MLTMVDSYAPVNVTPPLGGVMWGLSQSMLQITIHALQNGKRVKHSPFLAQQFFLFLAQKVLHKFSLPLVQSKVNEIQ